MFLTIFLVDDTKSTKMTTGKKQLRESVPLSVDMQRFAELRAQHNKKKPKVAFVGAKSTQENDSSDDDWLDDEQWYCEHKAQWTGGVNVSGPVLTNFVALNAD